ncbi:TetR/AcrR family transcriptional regulator [Dactylosporangium sp. CS-047395]|uniref:TetR/AcrR family transcriptional regulator n=1 Tax=Dactylosporangium sp. CS-047395 TaxID=3239936 RepID=UPI003D8B85AB
MSDTAVTWLPEGGGLRERKKRQLRARLSATATHMFLERGFDAVRVAEIADACGVSERTVFNYFPTKESLLLDRFDDTLTALRTALADPATAPLPAALAVLDAELDALVSWLSAQPDPAAASEQVRRFRELSTSTPELRAHQHDMSDRLTGAITELLAASADGADWSPEAHIAAVALAGLWRVQAASLRRHPHDKPAALRTAVRGDVDRAATTLAPMFSRIG